LEVLLHPGDPDANDGRLDAAGANFASRRQFAMQGHPDAHSLAS
tara:strand:- start:1821 stop:1952 length:132 start_codon:yes stop_codon:yes gene_type:complete